MATKLKAPFPYFGGKSRVAPLIWSKFGDVDNFIEAFCGSAAVLLGRPHAPRIETINDMDCMVANFWRATAADPDSVAAFADGPVNEADLHARHRWLVLSAEAKDFRRRMRSDPTYYDVRFAGWWCWGLCCWIGGGWCTLPGESDNGNDRKKCMPQLNVNKGVIHTEALSPNRKPRIDGGEGQYGHGVHAKGDDVEHKRPRTHSEHMHTYGGYLPGVHGNGPPDTSGPQLADTFSRGRGVNGHDEAGTCEQRRIWLCDWFGRLRDRLRTVRVCCGDWRRVCDSDSVTTRLGVTGIFFDPPYGDAAGRDMNLYAVDSGAVAADVMKYCLERGANPMYRIALCGYADEGHEPLEAEGWEVVAWKAQGGYGNRSAKGKANADKERIWFSPHCQREADLFSGAATEPVDSIP